MTRAIPPQVMWILIIVAVIAIGYFVWIFRNIGTERKRTGRTLFEREEDFRSEIESEAADARKWAEEVQQADAAVEQARSAGEGKMACPKCGFTVSPPTPCEGCGWKHPLW